MSLNLKRFRGSFTFRLNLWYAFIFTLVAVSLYWLSYLALSISLEKKDREILDSRLKEYAAIYHAGGPRALEQWIQKNENPKTPGSLFVRVSRNNNNLLLLVPEDWVERDLSRMDIFGNVRRATWIRIPKDEERDLTMAAGYLSDGSLLQVGRSTNSRQLLLKPFQKVFLAVLVPMVLLGFFVGAIFTYKALQPVREIVSTTRTIIETGRLNERVPSQHSGDELQEMSELINAMLEKNERLIVSLRESLDNVAHDLRTPLTRLRAMTETALKNSTDSESTRELLADSLEESDRLLTLIKTLLDVAEAQSGAMKLNKESCDVSSLIREVTEVYEYVAEEKKITLALDLKEPVIAILDPARIRQVLANLVDNAIKYTEPGGQVKISAEKNDSNAFIRVEDTGMGIPPGEQPRIWDRLYRGDKSRSQRGLGLGLSLVKAFVQAHGGEATVSSEPDKGSMFIVRLPIS
jgi:heavy metal sensor kinase